MKYRIAMSTYAVVEADSPEAAHRELAAEREEIDKSESICGDMLLNAELDSITEDENDE